MNYRINYLWCVGIVFLFVSCQTIEKGSPPLVSPPFDEELSAIPDISIKRIHPDSRVKSIFQVVHCNGNITALKYKAGSLANLLAAISPGEDYWQGRDILPKGLYTVKVKSLPMKDDEMISKIIDVYKIAFDVERTIRKTYLKGWVLSATNKLSKANQNSEVENKTGRVNILLSWTFNARETSMMSVTSEAILDENGELKPDFLDEQIESYMEEYDFDDIFQIDITNDGYAYGPCRIDSFCQWLEKKYRLPVESAKTSDQNTYRFELKDEDLDFKYMPDALRRVGFKVKKKKLFAA